MISNKMKSLVHNNSTIRAMFEEGKRLADQFGEENIYDFSLGNPNVEPPAAVKEAILAILSEESPNYVHGYMNNSGYEDVRQAIAEHLNQKYQLTLTGQHIIMTCGAAGGLNILLKTLLNPGDEVIAFAPYFGEYANYTANFDGVLVESMTDPETFQPDCANLEKVISPKTKVLLINTPNNPTGVVYTADTLKKIAALIEQKEAEYNTKIYVISDEPYREIAYNGIEIPYLLHYFKRCFIGYSYSKSLSLPGERIGYLVVNPTMDGLDEILPALNIANRILGFVNAPSLFQRVIARTLGSNVDVSYYQRNRDVLYSHLTSLGFQCVKPEGAFYLFPKCPIPDEAEFIAIAKKHNILLVPGSSFHYPGYFRLAYCVSFEKIKASLPAFTQLAEELHIK